MSALTVWARRPDGSIAAQLTAWEQLDVVVRWRDVGRWTLVTDDPDTISFFTDRRAGVVVKRGDTVILSGPRDYLQLESRGGATTANIAGPDDTHIFADTLAWPLPASSVTAQTDAYDKRTGTAEALIRAYLSANRITRLSDDITLGASGNLGTSRTYRARFTNMLELAQAVVSSDPALGFRMAQQDDRTVGLQVWLADDLTTVGPLFDGAGGGMTDWTYVEEAPEVTRVIIGGGDEGAARMFRQRVNTTAEDEWERVIETFEDRRDVDPADSTAQAELYETGDEKLAEGAPTQSLRVQVSDALGITYGTDVTVGDLVRVYPAGVRVDDRITEATLSVTREQGEVTTLWVGAKDADPDERTERRARSLRRRLGQLERAF